jgi:hypothetical protein
LGKVARRFAGKEDRHALGRRSPRLPKFDYCLDESDPDVVVLLRRQDGAFVAAFSARGTMEGIVEAGKEDYAALLRENAGALGLAAEEQHQEQPESARPSNAAYSPTFG